ncbi:hypothetical protein BD311DRAFT_601008, partial [Dichomitus squalens]
CPLLPNCNLRGRTNSVQQLRGSAVQISPPFVALPNCDLQVLLSLASGSCRKD